MQPFENPVKRSLNHHYESDVHYVFQFGNWILRFLGIYPFVYRQASKLERLVSMVLMVICCSGLQFVILPFGYYVIFYEKQTTTRIKLFAALAFCVISLFKYCYLAVKGSAIGRCVDRVKSDWKILRDEEHRVIMMQQVTMSRNLTKICALFLYSGGLSYHAVMPLVSTKKIDNYTVRSLSYPGYEAFFNVQKDPTYEIIFFMHCFYLLVSGSITIVAYSLAAVLITHACGQIKIQILRLENLTAARRGLEENYDDRLAVTVNNHVKILRFIREIENALHGLFLIEVILSTLLMCLLMYCCMMEWKSSETPAAVTYIILLTSFTFNILIFCYIGELLLAQGNEIMNATYETQWYNLPGRKAGDLVLLLAISRHPLKLTAGKIIVLSLSTFGAVVKTSVVYLNMLRTIPVL